MSSTHGALRNMTGTEACCELAELLTQELGLTVTPNAVRHLFERRWSRLQILAHAVHDDYEPTTTAREAVKTAMINYHREPNQ